MWLIDSHNQPDRRAPAGCKFATSSRRCSMTRIWCPARGSGRWYWCPQPGDRSTSSTTTPGNPEVQRCGRHSRVSSRAPYSRRAAATFVRDPSLRLATRSGVPGLLCVARRPVFWTRSSRRRGVGASATSCGFRNRYRRRADRCPRPRRRGSRLGRRCRWSPVKYVGHTAASR
jgi:hypothetical protein